MGLTARDMSDMGRLAQLAGNPQDTTREEIFLAVASLYRVQDAHLNPRERELMRDILRRLTRDVEMAIRIALAERLADDASVPHDLVLLLADDAIEVARPIILRSPLLTDEDALKLIAECGTGHHEAIAARAHIGEPVTEALVKSDAETVLLALARNVTAKISSAAYEALVEKSRNMVGLQDPLARRADLPPELATKMCGWVSEALRAYIRQNYAVPAPQLEGALSEAKTSVQSEPAPAKALPDESARKLIEKLAKAGQLKAGFLLRVLHQGQIDLFDLAFARLVDLPLETMRRLMYESGAAAVAMSCRAVGIDRCVFATIFNLSRQAHAMRPSLSPADMVEVEAVFNGYSKATAMERLRQL